MNEVPKDLPREELMEHANNWLKKIGGGYIYFKFTCEECGTRCTLEEPNILYAQGECFHCGHKTQIREGGYLYSSKKM